MMSTNTTLELDVRVDFRDYWRATFGYMFRYLKFKLLLLLAPLSLLMFLVLSIKYPYSTPPYQLLILPGVVVVLFIILFINTQSVFSSKKFLQGNVRYVFSPDGVDAEAPDAPGHRRWDEIPKAFELKQDFLIFYTPERMYTIPKGSFQNEEQLRRLRELLKAHLGQKARLR